MQDFINDLLEIISGIPTGPLAAGMGFPTLGSLADFLDRMTALGDLLGEWWDAHHDLLQRFLAEYAAYLRGLAAADDSDGADPEGPASGGADPEGPDSGGDDPYPPGQEPLNNDPKEIPPPPSLDWDPDESVTFDDIDPFVARIGNQPVYVPGVPVPPIKLGQVKWFGLTEHVIHSIGAGGLFAVGGALISDVVCTAFGVWAMPGSTYSPGDNTRGLGSAYMRTLEKYLP